MHWAQLIDLIAAAIRIATPLMFAAMGGILSERAGVFAVGLEGMMLTGACGAAVATVLSGSPLVGILIAAVCAALLAAIIAVVTVRYGADNMVTGLAANILAIGLTSFMVRAIVGHGKAPRIHLSLLPAVPIPGLSDIPEIGSAFFSYPLLTYAALLLPIPLTLILTRTQLGLTLRATGENPMVVYATGANPSAIRICASSPVAPSPVSADRCWCCSRSALIPTT